MEEDDTQARSIFAIEVSGVEKVNSVLTIARRNLLTWFRRVAIIRWKACGASISAKYA